MPTYIADNICFRFIQIHPDCTVALHFSFFIVGRFWSKYASKTNNYTKWNRITKCFVIVSDSEFTCKILYFWGWNFKSVLLLFAYEIRSQLKFVGSMNLELALSSDQVFL